MEPITNEQQRQCPEGPFRWDSVCLPTPPPLKEAVDAGVFGAGDAGGHSPGPAEVAALTEEHARELLGAILDLHYLKVCQRRGVQPANQKPLPDNETGQKIAKEMVAETLRLTHYAEASLDAYASAFGFDAAEALHQAILGAALHPEFQLPETPVQKSLF